MLGTIIAAMGYPFRIDATELPARSDVFNNCPLYLLFVLIPILGVELDAPRLGLLAPHSLLPLDNLPITVSIFTIPFALAARPRSLRHVWCVLAAGLMLPLSNSVMPYAKGLSASLYPTVYDPYVIALDATLGAQPSFLLAKAFAQMPALARLSMAIYATIIFPVAIVALMEARRVRRTGLGALPTFLVIAGIGYVLYALTPAVGPAAYYGDAFPYLPGRAHPPLPRNAIPSLHTAWLLMAFLMTRGMSWPIRLTIGLWLIGTLIATLGTGEHYLTDLVVAVPFVLVLRALCATDVPWSTRERRAALGIGALLYAAWVLAIRGTIDITSINGLAPGAMAVTVVVSLWWEAKLAKAAELLPGTTGQPAWSGWRRRAVVGLATCSSRSPAYSVSAPEERG